MKGLSGQIIDSLTPGRVVGGIVVLWIGSFVVEFWTRPRYAKEIPRMGATGWGTTVKNIFGYYVRYHEWGKEGYQKYNKNGRCFVIPSAISRPYDIVVPRSQTAWFLEQPDRILGTHEAHEEMLYSKYNFLDKRLANDMQHARVIHKNLARNLTLLLPGIQTAVHSSSEAVFGNDTREWKKINVWDAWLGIVPKVTNLILVGEQLNKNEEFLGSMVKFTDQVVLNGFILNAFPHVTHPLFGWLFTIPNRIHFNRGAKHSVPLIKQRLHDILEHMTGNPEYKDWVDPPDFISWAIRLAIEEDKPAELDPVLIAKRLLPIEFAALHTTVLTGHQITLDLVHANAKDPSILHQLREEAARVFAEENNQWTKDGLSRLYRLDSAMRESMRISNFATTLVERLVVDPRGIDNKVEGWHAPKGSKLVLNMQGVHHDGDIYDDPEQYDPFRFSRPREEYERKASDEKSVEEWLGFKRMGMVTTSDSHVSFGHGRHACPGRFFVAHEMKMIVAYLLLNYDLRPVLDKKPAGIWFGQNIIPPLDAAVEIKRREKPYTCDDFM